MNINEVCIEVTSRCNLSCVGCFNKYSASHSNRNHELSLALIVSLFQQVEKLNIPMIRITGGEPSTHASFNEIINLKKQFSRLHLRLNTNAVNFEKIKQSLNLVDSYHISINGYNSFSDKLWTRSDQSFEQKIKTIQMLKNNNKYVRVGTILNQSNIENISHIFEIIKKYQIDHWELYRPIDTNSDIYLKNNLEQVCIKLAYFSYLLGKKVQIANAIPFCALEDKSILNSVATGGIYDDGNSRVVVDPKNNIKPSYYIEKILSKNGELNSAINSYYRSQLLNHHFLPPKCLNCTYLEKCKGGSRFKALIKSNSLFGPDPLMN